MNRLIAKLCLGFMLAAVCASAEDALIAERLVELKHLQVNQELRNLFDTLGVHVSDRVGNYIALKGSKDAVAAAEEALHRMDVDKPELNVELTGWLVVASSKLTGLEPLPEELSSVAKQLKTAFGYDDLKLLTSFVQRTRAGSYVMEGGLVTNDLVAGGKGVSSQSYSFKVNKVEVSGETAGARKVRLENTQLVMGPAGLSSDVDLKEGQKVVIGKTDAGHMPLILVLTARVLENE
jgi:hypothetical protein